ncbi:hypothetical protein NUSPORA_02165 [Nucleospora cyclopteri]
MLKSSLKSKIDFEKNLLDMHKNYELFMSSLKISNITPPANNIKKREINDVIEEYLYGKFKFVVLKSEKRVIDSNLYSEIFINLNITDALNKALLYLKDSNCLICGLYYTEANEEPLERYLEEDFIMICHKKCKNFISNK